jgi:hypothetical protein
MTRVFLEQFEILIGKFSNFGGKIPYTQPKNPMKCNASKFANLSTNKFVSRVIDESTEFAGLKV